MSFSKVSSGPGGPSFSCGAYCAKEGEQPEDGMASLYGGGVLWSGTVVGGADDGKGVTLEYYAAFDEWRLHVGGEQKGIRADIGTDCPPTGAYGGEGWTVSEGACDFPSSSSSYSSPSYSSSSWSPSPPNCDDICLTTPDVGDVDMSLSGDTWSGSGGGNNYTIVRVEDPLEGDGWYWFYLYKNGMHISTGGAADGGCPDTAFAGGYDVKWYGTCT